MRLSLSLAAFASLLIAQDAAYSPPSLAPLVQASGGDLAEVVRSYSQDLATLQTFNSVRESVRSREALRRFHQAWEAALNGIRFVSLSQDGRVDYIVFRDRIRLHLRRLELLDAQIAQSAALVPFGPAILQLWESRQTVEPVEPQQAAAVLARIATQIAALREAKPNEPSSRIPASRAALYVQNLRRTLREWNQFYDGYDPVFTWWTAEPYKKVDEELGRYAEYLRPTGPAIVGDPIGRNALIGELNLAMIPYAPEELVEIANKEFAWCDEEMRRASQELGFGDDWRRALEHVKNSFVAPGKQTAMVKSLALEGIEYVERNNLITVPPLARGTWRMEMMTPERQRINPFFTGGDTITVSYPTAAMAHEEKLMSMRGNNPHFSRATVFHELIPGHWLQQFMQARVRPYRGAFRTPFWIEGWALYWELLLWDRGFHSKPADRIGALFWRMHRCARIVFSLSFHLGKMTAPEAVDYLVNRVGHERENAAAEVRRSVEDSSYDPLYQAAYMLGGLQIRALRRELVESGKMKDREFHDTVLQLHSIPIEMVRATMLQLPLTKDYVSTWRFYQ